MLQTHNTGQELEQWLPVIKYKAIHLHFLTSYMLLLYEYYSVTFSNDHLIK